jgi:hypothetical protein
LVLIPRATSLGFADSPESTIHPIRIESTVFSLRFLKSAFLSDPSDPFSCSSITTGQSACGIAVTRTDCADAEGTTEEKMESTGTANSSVRDLIEAPPTEENANPLTLNVEQSEM